MNTIYQCIRFNNSSISLDGKPNITLMSKTQAKKLLIEGPSVTGVAVVGSNDEQITVKAKKEVIVSCGVFDLPKLLMILGIGPKAEPAQHGIQCIVYSAPVGQHLLDHPVMPHVFKLKDGYASDEHILRAGRMHDAAIAAYGKDQKGPYHNASSS